jgi:hypothetical protein
MVVGLLVVLPVFRMYGVFNRRPSGLRGDEGVPEEGGKAADGTKRR